MGPVARNSASGRSSSTASRTPRASTRPRQAYDFALAEVTITPARAKAVAFSIPYYNANQGVLIRKGLSPQPKSIAT